MIKTKGMMERTKVFSEKAGFAAIAQNKAWNKALETTSRSKTDASIRLAQYQKVFSRYEEMREASRMFSGYSEVPLLSNQYFNATVASYVRSFAGFLTIERDMDQPTALLWYNDLLGVTDNRKVLPNLGQENLANINARFTATAAIDSSAGNQLSTGKKLIPGSIEIYLVKQSDPSNLTPVKDDGKGNLLAAPGILESGSINYITGNIDFKVGSSSGFTNSDSFSVTAFEDVAGDPAFGEIAGHGKNRFKLEHKNITVTSEPDMLVAENNLMTMASVDKSIGANTQDIIGMKLTELYTKLINEKLVREIIYNTVGNPHVIDVSTWTSTFYDYTSRLDAFMAETVDIDTKLAKQSVKGVKATCYIVGDKAGDWFRKTRATGNFVDNVDSTYINDLLGYFNGIPVLRHEAVESNAGYAIHKTADGQLAPVIRGIFLPLTNSPVVGNYNNPSQVAQGIYYQEANKSIVPELSLKFIIQE
jgi:hypothetical protein